MLVRRIGIRHRFQIQGGGYPKGSIPVCTKIQNVETVKYIIYNPLTSPE
ncbi:hypothetical protein EZS27_006785 [termite gut metagenome]|uniref:Uncharacterized protein n=1 Tax=termite gut metagenome TaxID=433724 RepID=A0A5J4SHH6_9ZZZZ